MIQFRQISKQYNDGTKTLALDGVDLSINDGEFVFITGDSGAGKSTIVKLLMGMEKPTSGTVLVDGKNVGQMSRRKLPVFRRRFGCIFQNFQLLQDFNVYENVAFAQRVVGTRQKNLKKRVPKVLASVGLEDKMKSYPSQLSGGEQQRVAIARAVVNGPLYLIADEPTGNLDQTNTEEVMALLDSFNRTGTTVIVITHDAPMVKRMQKRVVELKDGHIVADTAWQAAEKAAESVKPQLENGAARQNTEADGPKNAPPEKTEEEPLPEAPPEQDDDYVQETLDLGLPEEEESAEQVEMDLASITPPQPDPVPELPKLVVPAVDLPESESAKRSKVVSEVLKGWTAPPEMTEDAPQEKIKGAEEEVRETKQEPDGTEKGEDGDA